MIYLESEGDPGHFRQLQVEFDRQVRKKHPAAVLRKVSVFTGDEEKLAAAIRAIEKPTAFVAAHTNVAIAASQQAPAVPLVLLTMADPPMLGFTQEPGKPGSNVTGFSSFVPFHLKHIELLRDCMPGIRRVGVIADKYWGETNVARRIANESEKLFGISVEMVFSETPEELDRIGAVGRRVDAWYFVDVPFNRLNVDKIMKLVRESGKPAIGPSRGIIKRGGLLAYELVNPDPWPRIAEIVGLVLSGVSPTDIPFDRPNRFQLVVSRSAADRFGIRLPKTVLMRADAFVD